MILLFSAHFPSKMIVRIITSGKLYILRSLIRCLVPSRYRNHENEMQAPYYYYIIILFARGSHLQKAKWLQVHESFRPWQLVVWVASVCGINRILHSTDWRQPCSSCHRYRYQIRFLYS